MTRGETAANPGVAVTTYDMNPGGDVMGRTVTTTDTFRIIASATTANWTAQATMGGALTGAGGNSMPATAIQVEGAPTTGTYTALGTTYRTVQAGIPNGTLQSGYFHLRVVVPVSQASDVYTGTLNLRGSGGGTSNVIAVTITVTVTDTAKQFEDTADPGVPLASLTVPDAVQGATSTTTQTFKEAIYESSANWTVQARMSGNMTSGGNSILSTAVYAETGPLTGTFTSLGTTYRSLETGIAASTLLSGAFRMRIVLAATQASGTYTGTLQVRVSNGGTSNIIAVGIQITVINTLKELNEAGSPGVPVTAITMPEGLPNATVTSTQTFKEIVNDSPTNWTAQIRLSTTTLVHSVTGTTMTAASLRYETAPLSGTFTSLSTTYQTVQVVNTPGLETGEFRLRVVIPAAADAGTYNGTLQLRVSNGGLSNVVNVAVAVQVTATITSNCVSTATNCTVPVTSFSFAETAPGGISAATANYRHNLSATNGNWALYAELTTDLTSTTTGDTLPDSALEVLGSAQAGTYAPLSGQTLVQNNIANTTLSSAAFSFRFHPDATATSGTFEGTVTMTVATL